LEWVAVAIRLEAVAPGVVRLVIDHPARRNALTEAMFRQLADCWPALQADPTVRCVIVRGCGEQAFCAGADLSVDWDACTDRDALIDAALLKYARFDKPVIAAINGHCVAGGLELALSADLRIAAAHASFALPEVRWGMFPSGGAAMKLPLQVPRAVALEWLLTGAPVDAASALRHGLVSQVLPLADLDACAERMATTIAANSPAAVQAVKRYCAEQDRAWLIEQRTTEQAYVDAVRSSGEARIGIEAFLDKRRPEYPDGPGLVMGGEGQRRSG
jgi:enoyl-CoA hydratase